ncbi:alpha-amylase family glycosyl hydrolase [Brucepastera parasyntrophica]|uniref:alpha-amylase family glycosyl hydrolase n=1 Tax=Brucepastera parasyntrophica TaxID=2880008 RepID=UPI00210DCD5C|nr:alpha-amylase family glycosyl hydrolase [Brucepastera parasyntrophica]
MPKLNTANPEVRDFLLGIAKHYITEFDIDGWRLDVANEIDHEFWRAFRKTVKAAKPDAYIVGEIWHYSMDWLHGDQYDAVMNYHFGQAIYKFLTQSPEVPDGHTLADRMTSLELSYPLPVIRAGFNLMESHDTARLISLVGGSLAKARQAWLVFALLPGSPCFYYGSEFGMTGGEDPDCRRCMPWEEEHQVPGQYEFITGIIGLRKSHIELCNRGMRQWIYDDAIPGLFGMRVYNGTEQLTVILNRNDAVLPLKDYNRYLKDEEIVSGGFTDIPENGFAYALTQKRD